MLYIHIFNIAYMLYTLITCGIYAVLLYNIIAYMCSKTQLDCKPAAYMQPVMQKHSIYAINQSGVVPIGTCSVPCQTKSHSPVAL